jgi:hypothetical protein
MSAKSRGAAVLQHLMAAHLFSLGLTSATNCFSLVDETQWSLLINHSPAQAAITLTVAGGGPEVLTCLNRQPEAVYRYRDTI